MKKIIYRFGHDVDNFEFYSMKMIPTPMKLFPLAKAIETIFWVSPSTLVVDN